MLKLFESKMARSPAIKVKYLRVVSTFLCIVVFVTLYFNNGSKKYLNQYNKENSGNPDIFINFRNQQFQKNVDTSSDGFLSTLGIFDGTLSPIDPKVLKYLRTHHLIPPSRKPYKFRYHMRGDIGFGEEIELKVLQALRYKKRGFFIECGANDGEFISNTIGLESELDWNGLLIEASPSLFKKLKRTNRKAWMSDVCLSGRIEKMEFLKSNLTDFDWRAGNGKIKPGKYKKHKDMPQNHFKEEDYASEGIVECFPLQSLLRAINVTTVDFFSLDVEGHEYNILKGIPFHDIDIKLLFVEHFLAPEGKQAIEDLMLINGYKNIYESGQDFIFIKPEATV